MTRHYLDILAEVIRDNWDSPALTDYSLLQGEGGNEYTYGQLYEKIQELCQLFSQLGLQPGDHIALCGANSANWAVVYLAIAAYQGVSVTILHTLSPNEIVNLIHYADSKAVFVDSEIWKSINELCLNAEQVISLEDFSIIQGTPYQGNECSFKPSGFTAAPLDNLAHICFTSGTSACPKGVMLSYRSLSNNITYKLDVFSHYCGSNMLALLPMAHIYGLVIEILLPLCAGARTYIVKDPACLILRDISTIIRPKIVFMVPTMLDYFFWRNENYQFWKCLDFVSIGGANISNKLEEQLYSKGIQIAVGYGMTECGSRISLMLPDAYRSNTVGQIVSGMEAHISPEGEILVRGDNVMLGYYKDEKATCEKIDKDGWLHTGDQGHLDEDGYLYIEGRMNQDMIVLPSGENIHPENIEVLINAIPHVVESLVLARKGKLVALVRKGEAVAPEQTIAERNAILAKINPQLPSFSQLFGIEFITNPLQRTEKQTIKRYMYQ